MCLVGVLTLRTLIVCAVTFAAAISTKPPMAWAKLFSFCKLRCVFGPYKTLSYLCFW